MVRFAAGRRVVLRVEVLRFAVLRFVVVRDVVFFRAVLDFARERVAGFLRAVLFALGFAAVLRRAVVRGRDVVFLRAVERDAVLRLVVVRFAVDRFIFTRQTLPFLSM